MDFPALQINSIQKGYGHAHKKIIVLSDVNLTVEMGTWVTLMGRSGCGKTTLLRILGAIDFPDSGEIKCFGKPVQGMSAIEKAKLRRTKLGFIFQSYHLFTELDALENVILPGRLGKLPLKQLTDRAKNLLENLGIGNRLSHRPNELSGGEQQRVAIARSLMNNPDIILADEPTGNLDEKNTEDIMAILQKLRTEENKTIVMVTHDKNFSRFADQSYTIENGMISQK